MTWILPTLASLASLASSLLLWERVDTALGRLEQEAHFLSGEDESTRSFREGLQEILSYGRDKLK